MDSLEDVDLGNFIWTYRWLPLGTQYSLNVNQNVGERSRNPIMLTLGMPLANKTLPARS